MLFTFRSIPRLPSTVVLLAAPTSLLIICLPSLILLSSGRPASAAPSQPALTLMNAKQEQEDLDLKRFPSHDRVPAFNHPPPPFVQFHHGKPGRNPGPWPGNGNGHGNGNGNWNGPHTTTTTTSRTSSTSPPAIIITEIPQPYPSSPAYYNKLGPGICYDLCRAQMGGVACNCDIMPIG